MLFEREFYEILDSFEQEQKQIDWSIKDKSFPIRYSILGSPLMESNLLIMGTNWAGGPEIPTQSSMPLVNDILAYYIESQTYRGYLNFFKLLIGNLDQTIGCLNNSILMNGCFIHTPKQGSGFRKLVQKGFELSKPYIKEIIDMVKPKIILCFGNGNNPTGTSQISSILINDDQYWLLKDRVIQFPLSDNMSSYHYNTSNKNSDIHVFSFPHASRFNQWKKGLEMNGHFRELKKRLKT